MGYASGPASLYFLRGESPFGSLHALLSSVALAGFAAAGILGLQLERGAGGRIRVLHALCGGLGLLVALATAVAGFAILP